MTEKPAPPDPSKKDAAPTTPQPAADEKQGSQPLSAVEKETQQLIEKMLKNRRQPGQASDSAEKAESVPPAPAAAPIADDSKKPDTALPQPAKAPESQEPTGIPADAPTPVAPAPQVSVPPVEGGTARLNRPPADPAARAIPVDATPAGMTKEEAKAAARTTNVSRNVPGRGKQEVWKVLFQPLMASPVKEVGVEVKGLLVVGRVEEGSPSKPDVDLNPFGAGDLGVSRMHVILTPSGEGPCITDMNSTNGTWINGLYLEPGRQYRLRTNDRVEFGSLKLVVKVISPNEDQPGPQ